MNSGGASALSVEALRDRFFAFETSRRLFERDFRGAPFWDSLRYYVYTDVALQLGVLSAYTPMAQVKLAARLRSFAGELMRVPPELLATGRRALSRPRRYDVIFFECDTKKLIDGKRVDYRGYPFVESIARDLDVLTIDPSRLTEPVSRFYPCDVVSSRLLFLWTTLRARLTRLTPAEDASFRHVEQDLLDELGVCVDVVLRLRQVFLPQYYSRAWYRRLFARHRPALVGFLNDGRKQGVVDASHGLGIPTFEVQHGATSTHDLVTSYPPGTTAATVRTLPDHILTFGEYWSGRYNNPAAKTAVGFPYFERERARLLRQHDGRLRRGLIGVSVDNRALADTLLKTAQRLPDVDFYFKLRPSEYDCWQRVYDPMLGQLPNLVVIDNEDVSLYEYFLRVSYLLTINSTAVWEGLGFGVVPVIHRGPYFEEAVDLVETGHAFLVDGPDDLTRILEGRLTPPARNPGAFFADNSEGRMRSAIGEMVAAARAASAGVPQ